MKLFYVPNTCALAPQIVLGEAGLPFELDRIDLKAGKKTQTGADYVRLNPKGYVPALVLDDGELLTEVAVILQYLADLKPEARLAPAHGTRDRLRLQEWLNFIATELHKGMSPLYQPWAPEEFKTSWVEKKLEPRFAVLSQRMDGREFLLGDGFSVGDAYAFYVLRAWQTSLRRDLNRWKPLEEYFTRIARRPSVQDALQYHPAPPG